MIGKLSMCERGHDFTFHRRGVRLILTTEAVSEMAGAMMAQIGLCAVSHLEMRQLRSICRHSGATLLNVVTSSTLKDSKLVGHSEGHCSKCLT